MWICEYVDLCEYVGNIPMCNTSNMLIYADISCETIVLELGLTSILHVKERVRELRRTQSIKVQQFVPLLHKDLQLDILLIM